MKFQGYFIDCFIKYFDRFDDNQNIILAIIKNLSFTEI